MRTSTRLLGALLTAACLLPVAVAPTQAAQPTVKKYSMAQVAKHRTATDCWTVVNGSVYNVTKWIARHPGGQGAILGLCGKDGTAAFTGKHAGDRSPANMLRGFKIGVLR